MVFDILTRRIAKTDSRSKLHRLFCALTSFDVVQHHLLWHVWWRNRIQHWNLCDHSIGKYFIDTASGKLTFYSRKIRLIVFFSTVVSCRNDQQCSVVGADSSDNRTIPTASIPSNQFSKSVFISVSMVVHLRCLFCQFIDHIRLSLVHYYSRHQLRRRENSTLAHLNGQWIFLVDIHRTTNESKLVSSYCCRFTWTLNKAYF